jgi:hypothetical protein
VINPLGTARRNYNSDDFDTQMYEDEMQPYLSLFRKPLTSKKSKFSKKELEVMCKDPLHSPRLIRYLIDFVRDM